MRIGISTSVIQRGKTGIAQYLFALLRAFAAAESSHRFVLFVLEEDVPLFDFLGGRFEIVRVAEKYRPAVSNIRWHQNVLPGLARKLNLDVLHVPSYRRMLMRKPCALVATIHDLAPFHVSGKYDLARMFYGKVMVKYLARRQDRIIAISQNTANDIERFFGIGGQAVKVVYNGLEHERFFPTTDEEGRMGITRKHRLNKPFFLYVARLEHPGKNHVRLIEAFENFRRGSKSDWQLVFGGSDWHGAEAIHARINASPLKDEIRSLGFVSNEDLPQLYRAASAFVYPSLFEGFGLPPVEAMACGCPVICSASGSLGEVVADAARIVDPQHTDSISRAMNEFTVDSELREQYRTRGLVRARFFDWTRTASEVLGVYASAVSSRPGRQGGFDLPASTTPR